MKARRYGIWAGLAIVAAITSGALLAQAPQAIGTWVSVGDLSSPLTNGAAVALPDKRTLIAGGALADGTLTDAVTIYDSVDDSATAAGTLTSARADHTATLLKDGRVLVVGGMTADGLISPDIEIFDPATGASAIVALLPEPRNGHVAAALPNGDVLIAGGATVDGTMLQTAILFDPETSGVSSVPGQLHTARIHASATTTLDGRVLVAGGNNGTAELASAEIFDRYSQSFSMAATQMSVGRQGHSAVLLPDNGGVLVAGGTSNGGAQAGVDLFLPAVFPDPFSYGEGEFTATGAMTAARTRAVAGPTSIEGFAFAAGGGAPDAEVYRFATIKTDKDDYAPGELATITGSGWQANEEVTLLFQEDPAVHDDYVLKVNADGNGNIFWNQWAPEHHDLGVRFYLTATGSQSRAQITFTDAAATNTAATSSPNPSTPGQIVTVTATVTSGTNVVTQGAVKFYYGGQNCTGNPGTQFGPVDGVNLDGAGQASAATNALTNGVVVRACYGGFGSGSSSLQASPGETIQNVSSSAKSDQTITFGALAGKTYGDADFGVTATASSGLPVTFTASGQCAVTGATVHISGAGSCEVTASQPGNSQYNAAPNVSRMFTIGKATPVVTWATPADITYGTLLSATQLNATADVAGSFVYTPAAGVKLNAGPNQTLSVSFTPTDTANYNDTAKTVQITVLKATPVLTWATPVDITYGTLLSATQLNATADVDGSFVYTPAAGVKLNAGPNQTLSVSFTPTDTANYNDTAKTVQITVLKATPVLTWATPVDITYGTLLSATQLNATADVDGSFVYTPAAGVKLNAGPNQTLSVSFTPTDTANYNDTAKTVQITVLKATPVLTWATPVDITYGTLLSATQLNATADVDGSFVYTPAAGVKLNAGPNQTLSVSFTPTDTANYNDTAKTVQITVLKATPVLTWATPVDITYGTLLSATQLNATADVDGSFVYTPAAGVKLNAGPNQTLSVSFTPTDTANYNDTAKTVQITVLKATPVLTWATPVDITYGTLLSATQLNATADVDGSFVYTPAAGVKLNAGPNQTLSVSFTPTDTANYNDTAKTVQITVLKATPVLTWATPVDITYGTLLSATQLNATADVDGSFVYMPAAGVKLNVGPNQTLSVTFTPNDTANYNGASKTVQINVLYRWDGFLQPINDTAHDLVVMSKFKTGQTIPAKFVLKNAAGATVQQTGIPTFTRTGSLGACDSASALENPEPVSASVVPQYTWDGAQYHYNWSTKGLPAGLYRIFANLADGTARSVDICLTK